MAAPPNSGTTMQSGKLDSPPPQPPPGASKPTQADWSSPQVGTPPTGQLEQVVLDHAMLAEQILSSLSQMLPSFSPVASQIVASLRVGVVQALKQAKESPQQSLAAGAGPSTPPSPPLASQGAPAGGAPSAIPPPPSPPPPSGLGTAVQ